MINLKILGQGLEISTLPGVPGSKLFVGGILNIVNLFEFVFSGLAGLFQDLAFQILSPC